MNVIQEFINQKRFPELDYKELFKCEQDRTILRSYLEMLKTNPIPVYLCNAPGIPAEFGKAFNKLIESMTDFEECTLGEQLVVQETTNHWGVAGWIFATYFSDTLGDFYIVSDQGYIDEFELFEILGFENTPEDHEAASRAAVVMTNLYRIHWINYMLEVAES